jgi:hypothetical protein
VPASLYNRFPKLENFEDQILEEKNNFDNTKRETLLFYKTIFNVETSVLTQQNIEALNNSNTFTVTTGHQLNLF